MSLKSNFPEEIPEETREIVESIIGIGDVCHYLGSVRDTCKKVTSLTPKQCPQLLAVGHVVSLEHRSSWYPKNRAP